MIFQKLHSLQNCPRLSLCLPSLYEGHCWKTCSGSMVATWLLPLELVRGIEHRSLESWWGWMGPKRFADSWGLTGKKFEGFCSCFFSGRFWTCMEVMGYNGIVGSSPGVAQGHLSHKTMATVDRVQNSMSDYLLMDLFRLIADQRCGKLSLPKSTFFLHPETMRNVQHVGLAVIAVSLTGCKSGNPFARGHQRLTELAVEEHFGSLRTQSVSAQLTARSFWKAAAREMVRAMKSRKPCEPPSDSLEPISKEDFLLASRRALKSALRLVSWASAISVESLEMQYREWCECGQFRAVLGDMDEEDDELEVGEDAAGLLKSLQDEANMECDLPEQSADPVDFELRHVPDNAELKAAFSKEAALDSENLDGPETLTGTPKTLFQAMYPLNPDSSAVVVFDRLWRLLMSIRYWRGGGDVHWIRNPRACRRKTSGLNWYQYLYISLHDEFIH